jgi:ABC-2 type transport system ATP-binding protein
MILLKDINFQYTKKKPLFNQLCLEIGTGQIYGLLGKNGAGKTSLLKILSGLQNPQSGTCNILGYNPFDRNACFLEHIFLVPEVLYLPSISAKRYVNRYAKFYSSFDYNALYEYMESFEIEKEMHLGKSSYGQNKKFVLAFALASGAQLVLFDEPTNGLDIPSKSIFRKLAASAISEDGCFIMSTHQVRDLNKLLDCVILLDKGKILLNKSIFDISSAYSFISVPRGSDVESVVYSEEHIEGIKVVVPNDNQMETEVDMEMLFNATIAGKLTFN